MPEQPACIFGDDEGGACETPAAWLLTAGGVAHPACGRHRGTAEDRLTDLELGRVVAEPVLPASSDERWHWCDPILLHVYELDPPETCVLSASAQRVVDQVRRGEGLTAEERAWVERPTR